MRISTATEDWLGAVTVSGELDAGTAPLLREALDEQLARGIRWLLVDLQGLDFIGSVGIGELIRITKRLGEIGGDLAVVCQRPNVRRVFEISGTSELLHLHQDRAAARRFLEASCRERQTATPREEGEGDGQTE